MDVKLQVREKDAHIIDVAGSLSGDGTLLAEVRRMVEVGTKNILINLKGVTWMDERGTKELVGCMEAIRNCGGVPKVLNFPSPSRSGQVILLGHWILEVFYDETKALLSYR